MASVQQQGKKYTVRFRWEGTMYRITLPTVKKAERTKAFVEQTIDDIRAGKIDVPADADIPLFMSTGGKEGIRKPKTQGKPTAFDAAADHWIAKRTGKAQTTQAVEAIHLKHLKGYFKGRPLRSIGDDAIRAYLDSRPVSDRTKIKELLTLAGILGRKLPPKTFGLAAEGKTPFRSIEHATDGRRALLDSQDTEELRKLVREKGTPLIADIVDLVAYTGLRRSEVCRILPRDVDLANNRLTITEKKRKHGEITHRHLLIHPELRDMLSRRVAEAEHPFLPVFTHSVNTISAGFAAAIKGSRFDVPGFGLHALRHSLGSRAVRTKPIAAVAAVLGHATPLTTANIYTHAFQHDADDVIGSLK